MAHEETTIGTRQTKRRLKPVFHDPERAGDPRVALTAFANHLPVLTKPELVFGIATPARSAGGGVIEVGYFTLGPEAVALTKDVYAYGWVRDFDWMSWSHTAEGRHMLHDSGALEDASEEDLARVLTVCMREAHWGAEALDTRYRDGLLTRVMRRAEALLRLRN